MPSLARFEFFYYSFLITVAGFFKNLAMLGPV